jgi:type VI secretion system protein ImpI
LYSTDNTHIGDYRFAALPIRIGRNALNDCAVNQNFVSDFHARIEETDGRISVRDLNSKNGVYLRPDKNRTPTRIPPQTPVELGPYDKEFFIGPLLRAQVEVTETDFAADRAPSSMGTVLGNRRMLEAGFTGERAALPKVPSLAPLPPLDAGRAGVASPIVDVGAPPHGGAVANGPPPQAGYGAGASGHGSYGGAHGASTSPATDLKRTGHFDMTKDALALQGLRELAGSLVPGRPLETNGDVARLITKLHDALEVFCRCFIPLRQGYAQFVSSMDLQRAAMERSVNRSRSYLAVQSANDPAAVAAALLDWRDPALDAPQAIEGIFADLMVHQVALLDGVMRGVRALLDELAPENIERFLQQSEPRGALGFQLGRYKSLWEIFCERYEQLSEERQAFSHIFGPEFTQAYREYRRGRTEPPPRTPR